MLVPQVAQPDPELARHVPPDTVVMKDTGAAEFGMMEFGGLKLKPEALAAARNWDPKQEMTVSNACKAPSIVYALQGPFPIEIFQGTELLVMRLAVYDMARVIFLDGRAPWPADAPHTKSGLFSGSLGRRPAGRHHHAPEGGDDYEQWTRAQRPDPRHGAVSIVPTGARS